MIHGVEYGVSYVGGPGFRDDARRVRLGELGLRASERFTYEYNFTAGWQVDLRVEQIQPGEPGRVYPRCTGGRAEQTGGGSAELGVSTSGPGPTAAMLIHIRTPHEQLADDFHRC